MNYRTGQPLWKGTGGRAGAIEGLRRAVGQIDVEKAVAVVVEETSALSVDVDEGVGDRVATGDFVGEAGLVGDVVERGEGGVGGRGLLFSGLYGTARSYFPVQKGCIRG